MEIMSFDQEINTFKLQISAPRELLYLSTGEEFVNLDALKVKITIIEASDLPCLYLITKKTEYIEDGFCKRTDFQEFDEFIISESGTIGILNKIKQE